jgi:iron-sulfur cluster assembly protein
MTTEEIVSTITTDLTFQQVFDLFPEKSRGIAGIMTESGLHCVGCGAATWETLAQGMRGHGMSDDAIEDLVSRLNAYVSGVPKKADIIISDSARAKIDSLRAEDGRENWGLFFGLEAGGCQGEQYEFMLAEYAKDNESTYISDGLSVFIPTDQKPKLIHSKIDYTEGAEGFSVENDKVTDSCGCGTSVSF